MICKRFIIWLIGSVVLVAICGVDSVRQFSIELPRDHEGLSPYEIADKYLKDAQERPNVQEDSCVRTCRSGSQKRICYYEFTMEIYQTLGRACGNCSAGVAEDCAGPQCVTGDGILRTIFSVNRQLPGTKIEVCKGDMVAVRVINKADGLGITIHWHGLMMRDTPYMDGIPMVTQYPIASGDYFLYTFWAANSGTYMYHAHSGQHFSNGICGPLIIKDDTSLDQNFNFYDTDNDVMFLMDWNHMISMEFRTGLSGGWPDAILVNGRGKSIDPQSNNVTMIPYKVFHVKGGDRSRIRVIAATTTSCPLRIQIEEHKMHVIAADGFDVKPFEVDTLMVHAGERYDIVVECSKLRRNYWIHIQGGGLAGWPNVYQVAVLSCDGDTNNVTLVPETPKPDYIGYKEEIYLNNPNTTCQPDDNKKCVHQLEAYNVDEELLYTSPDIELVIKLSDIVLDDSKTFDNNSDNWQNYLTFIEYDKGAITTINKIQSVATSAPLITQLDYLEDFGPCHKRNWPERCKGKKECTCPHVHPIPLNTFVKIILLGADDNIRPVNHPIHLHGHSFQVLEVGQFSEKENVTAHNLRKKKYDIKSPAFKDTLSIPSHGYGVVKFRADNPGVWLMHCHIEHHMLAGMMMIFQAGYSDDLPRGPPNTMDYHRALQSSKL